MKIYPSKTVCFNRLYVKAAKEGRGIFPKFTEIFPGLLSCGEIRFWTTGGDSGSILFLGATIADTIPIKGTQYPPLLRFPGPTGGSGERIVFPWDWGGSAIDEDYDDECCAGWSG